LTEMTAGLPEKAVRLSEDAVKKLQEDIRWPEDACEIA
jgi:hypothetical protein